MIINSSEKKTTISANTLFHFTNSMDKVESILLNNFQPKYCCEDIKEIIGNSINLDITIWAIPMVCFCDIPLSQIRDHIDLYGGYGIGLTKEWGINNKVNPVMYINHNSLCLEHMVSCLQNLQIAINETDKISNFHLYMRLKSIEENLNYFSGYFKPYEGIPLRENKKINKKIRYYDEKEWRFIPDGHIFRSNHLLRNIPIDERYKLEPLNSYNDKLGKCCQLKFESKDIKYIIVKKESEIPEMIEKIKSTKIRFSPDNIDLLITRVISQEQILEDF